jgi:hypothetical protein
MMHDGRASIPTLTKEGERKAADLGQLTSPSVWPRPAKVVFGIFSVLLADQMDSRLGSDNVCGKVHVRLKDPMRSTKIEATAQTDLTAVSTRLLGNWWRILCRRDEPFELFAVAMRDAQDERSISLHARATGARMELTARADQGREVKARLTEQHFMNAVLGGIVRPVAHRLDLGMRFGRPVAAMLRRMEDVSHYPNEVTFCRTAGALGLSPHGLDSATAEKVRRLIDAFVGDDARLDFASAISPDLIEQTSDWLESEMRAREGTNTLPALPELSRTVHAKSLDERLPYETGYACARAVRAVWKMSDDCPLDGAAGLARRSGGAPAFAPSQAGEGRMRGFQARGDTENPIVVIRDEGARSNLFLMARAIGDFVWFGNREAPIADLYTDRQALGRAFAAELLAPRAAVIDMVEAEDKSFGEIADHYGVVLKVIENQYRNSPLEEAPVVRA